MDWPALTAFTSGARAASDGRGAIDALNGTIHADDHGEDVAVPPQRSVRTRLPRRGPDGAPPHSSRRNANELADGEQVNETWIDPEDLEDC